MRVEGFTRRTDDEGASLIIAMVFITIAGLALGSLLAYSQSSIRAATVMRDRAQTDYDTDGALQTAINTVRQSQYDNASGQTCLGSGRMAVRNGSGGTVWVTCAPGDGTGAAAGLVPISGANRFRSAILTLGSSAAEHGLDLGSLGALTVKGQVVSNTNVHPGGAGSGITVLGDAWVKALGSCGSSVITPGSARHCNYTIDGDAADFADPAYPPPPSSASDLTWRRVPACSANKTTPIVFQPGYYDDAVLLTHLTDNSTCPGRTLWFRPGQYYFDFHNAEGGGGLASGSDLWSVTDANVRVVAGTPNGWTVSPFTAPTIPGSCISPMESTTAGQGVQFTFGGDSRLAVTSGQMEICGQYYPDRPPIALYGMRSGSDPVSTADLTTNGSGTTTGSPTFTNLNRIQGDPDGSSATVNLVNTRGGLVSAGVTVGDFSTAAIPPGSILTAAEVDITHSEIGSTRLPTATATIDTGGDPFTVSIPWTLSGLGRTERRALTAAQLANIAENLHDGTPISSSVQVAVSVGPHSMAMYGLDSIQLKLTYKPPAMRGETTPIDGSANCIGAVPYSSNCTLLYTDGSNTRFYLQGAIYAPRAALNIHLTNVAGQVIRAGVVARALAVTVTASADYTGPLIEVPDDSLGFVANPLSVYFTAYVCPDGANCSGVSPPDAPWRSAGQANATFTDTNITPVAGSRVVTVKSWQIPR